MNKLFQQLPIQYHAPNLNIEIAKGWCILFLAWKICKKDNCNKLFIFDVLYSM